MQPGVSKCPSTQPLSTRSPLASADAPFEAWTCIGSLAHGPLSIARAKRKKLAKPVLRPIGMLQIRTPERAIATKPHPHHQICAAPDQRSQAGDVTQPLQRCDPQRSPLGVEASRDELPKGAADATHERPSCEVALGRLLQRLETSIYLTLADAAQSGNRCQTPSPRLGLALLPCIDGLPSRTN